MAALAATRKAFPVLRHGRQYLRPISFLGKPFSVYGPGEIVAWSRILDDEEALVVVNGHGTEDRGADILVDASLNPEGSAMTVAASSAEAASAPGGERFPTGARLPVSRAADGKAFVTIRDLPPSEVLVLVNHPAVDEGDVS